MQNENLLYIYAAQNEVKIFKEHSNFELINKRIEYLGFIDTLIYAKVIDLMIDTFPFGSGVIGMQMLANSNSIISLHTSQTEVSSWQVYANDFLKLNFHRMRKERRHELR